MATKKKTKMGVAVALAIEALRSPAVQSALRQAPSIAARLRQNIVERKYATDASGAPRASRRGRSRRMPKLSEAFGQGRLEKRAANLRGLVAELRTMPAGERVDPNVLRTVDDALDAIDVELRVAAHQDLRDRVRLHRRISGALDELVDAITLGDARVIDVDELPPAP
jgi:hypothetical protein